MLTPARRGAQHSCAPNLRLVVSIKKYVGRSPDLTLLILFRKKPRSLQGRRQVDWKRAKPLPTLPGGFELSLALADQSRTIRIPVHMVETIARNKQVSRRLAQALGRDPQPGGCY